MKKISLIATVLFALLLAPQFAAEVSARKLIGEDGESYYLRLPKLPFTPQHEFRLAAGAFPIVLNSGHGFHNYFYRQQHLMRQSDIYTAGVWTLSYDYRIKRWFDIGATVSYYGEYGKVYSDVDNRPLGRIARNRIALMPVVRFTWLNRTWVRMYSSFGMGFLIDTERETSSGGYAAFAGQYTPIGITVGKSLFGFAEVGVGTQGTLILGIGYRFNDKKSK